jgi:hypothetical protein
VAVAGWQWDGWLGRVVAVILSGGNVGIERDGGGGGGWVVGSSLLDFYYVTCNFFFFFF